MNLVDTWALRPDATTRIPNLFLASDYVRTYTDLATMEGANEAARRAVNGLLDAVKFVGPRCGVWPLQQPEILVPLQQHDAARYAAGLPWDDTLTQVAVEAVRGASPLLAQVTPLLEDAWRRYVSRAADALERSEGTVPGVTELSRRGAMVSSGSADAPRLEPEAMIVGAAPVAGDVAGPAGLSGAALLVPRDARPTRSRPAIPTLEPQQHLYRPCERLHRPIGQGACVRRCASRPRAPGRPHRGCISCRRPASKCCTTLFSCTTTSRTAANRGVAWPPCIAVPGYPLPSTPATP